MVNFAIKPLKQSGLEGEILSFRISIESPNYSSQPAGYKIHFKTNNTGGASATSGDDYYGYTSPQPSPHFT